MIWWVLLSRNNQLIDRKQTTAVHWKSSHFGEKYLCINLQIMYTFLYKKLQKTKNNPRGSFPIFLINLEGPFGWISILDLKKNRIIKKDSIKIAKQMLWFIFKLPSPLLWQSSSTCALQRPTGTDFLDPLQTRSPHFN